MSRLSHIFNTIILNGLTLTIALPLPIVKAGNCPCSDYTIIYDNCHQPNSNNTCPPQYSCCEQGWEPQCNCTPNTCCEPTCCQPNPCCSCLPTTCCPPCFETPCARPRRKRGGGAGGALLGALILGAGAGAGYAAGNSNCHRKKDCDDHHHSDHDKCSNCGQDIGENLVFHLSMAANIDNFYEEFSGEAKVTSFVVDPRGCMTLGKSKDITIQQDFYEVDVWAIPLNYPLEELTNLIVYDDMISICDPLYGTYHFGLQFEFNQLPKLNVDLIFGEVKSSKTQTTTTIPLQLPISVNLSGVKFIQSTEEFSYAPDIGIPSKPSFP